MTNRIGLLMVHGVGEQKRFEHLRNETGNLIDALKNDNEIERLHVHDRTAEGAPSRALPPEILIHFVKGQQKFEVTCREVYWADVNDGDSLKTQIYFWSWGLGQWLLRRSIPEDHELERLERLNMELPGSKRGDKPDPRVGPVTRLRLFLIGAYFSLVLVTLSIANFLLSRIMGMRLPGSEIIVQYVGDVKFYQQDHRLKARPAPTGLVEAPRVEVRRRMVQGMVDMAISGVDRWYILAHSLGTVVAFNGLMETGHALPNYLAPEQWDAADQAGLASTAEDAADVQQMSPARPVWLKDEAAISRRALFRNLRGFLTYGSPLDKFAELWPKIVPMNREKNVFRSDFEWVNVFDRTDTIAGNLDEFSIPTWIDVEGEEPGGKDLRPINVSYEACPFLLFSHLRYLNHKPRGGGLIDSVVKWVVSSQPFETPGRGKVNTEKEPAHRRRIVSAYLQWAVLALFLAIVSDQATFRAIGEGAKLIHLPEIPAVSSLWSSVLESTGEVLRAILALNDLVQIVLAALIVTGFAGVFHRGVTWRKRRIAARLAGADRKTT